MKELGMYIHIPFCKRKCYYCDFYSVCVEEQEIEKYCYYLKKELQEVGEGIQLDVKQHYQEPTFIKTIYIGGGTPSLLESQFIVEILEVAKKYYCIVDEPEITIEVNPGTITKQKLQDYQKAGINRLSIGMQSTSNEMLQRIGRIHTWEEFLNTYKLAREIGFNNINIDCMIGLPEQTMGEVEEMLQKVIELNPEHISVYSLIVEEGTKLEQMLKEKAIKLPEEELERKMYWKVTEELEKQGYKQYEISNYAKPGFQSKHNLDCWQQNEYIGFGAGAHSYTNQCRYSNIADIQEYIRNYEVDKPEDNLIFHEKQDKTAMAKEFILLALRTMDGCDKKAFYHKFGYALEKGFAQELEKLTKEELIMQNEGSVILTKKGMNLANLVWQEFI